MSNGCSLVFGLIFGMGGLGGCVSASTDSLPLVQDSPAAEWRAQIVAAREACTTSARVIMSGTLSTGKDSLGFEALSERRPESFVAEFLSPIGNTLAVLEAHDQGNNALAAGLPAGLETLSAADLRNLVCGTPSTLELLPIEDWSQSPDGLSLSWRGPANFAGQTATSAVTVSKKGTCDEGQPVGNGSDKRNSTSRDTAITLVTDLKIGRFFPQTLTLTWHGCLSASLEGSKEEKRGSLTLSPRMFQIQDPSKKPKFPKISARFFETEFLSALQE